MASFAITNKTNIQAYAGIELVNGFKPKLQQMLTLHGGLKFYVDVQCLMIKYLDGEVLTKDTRWVASQLVQTTNSIDLNKKLTRAITINGQGENPRARSKKWLDVGF